MDGEVAICEHGRPRDDCPLCDHDEEFDDVIVDVEAWAETVLREAEAEAVR